MTVTAASFVADFPEFGNQVAFPTSTINLFITLGANRVDTQSWGDMADYGVELFVAHNIVLNYNRRRAASAGGAPGKAQGPLSAKSVDRLSMSFDTGSVTFEGAGTFNMTDYGIQYWELVQLFGAGGMQLGGCGGPGVDVSYAGNGTY